MGEISSDPCRLKKFLSKLHILVCLILLRLEKNRDLTQMRSENIYTIEKRFRIAKVAGYFILKYGSEKNKKRLIWYRHGVYPVHLERTLKILLEKGIVGETENRFFLTTEGLSWISNRIEHVKDSPQYIEILDEIDQCLFTPMPELITRIAKLSPHLNYKEHYIGSKKICKVFDWKNFGSGIIEPYHYTLLLSYSYSEKYFEEQYFLEAEKVSKKNEFSSPRFINYDNIPNVISSDNLKKRRRKYMKELVPLVHIFDKKDPSYLTQIKIEGKNYIANLWYVIESINIIHVLSGLRPSCDEIARTCLTNYLVNLQGYNSKTKEIRRMRERMIKNDITKLFEHGILSRKKWERTYIYQLSAKSYYDVILEKEYEVLDEELMKELYNKKIRPYRLDFRDPFGIEGKIPK